MTQPADKPATESSRRGVRRTAWVLGAVAVSVYVGFLLSVFK